MMKIIKGDSIVLMTKKQADDINVIFSKQKTKITNLQSEVLTLSYKNDSLKWVVMDQDNWIDYATLQIVEDSISNVTTIDMSNRVKELRAAVVSYNKTNANYSVFPLGNYDTSKNKKGEITLKPKRYAERSDWYALLFTALTITNLMVFLN